MSQVFAVKIILQDKASPVAENTDIGLYNVTSDNSEFRWTQNSISGVTTWKDGMIIEKGIKPFSIGIDLKRGGAASLPGSGSVIVKNNLKLWQTIEALGITLLGLRAELYIFNDTTPIKLRTYSCGEPTWDGFNYTIPFKGRQEASIAQMLKLVNVNDFSGSGGNTVEKRVPATFGNLSPNSIVISNSLAKFIRHVNIYDDNLYTNNFFTGTYPLIKVFPVTGASADTLTYTIAINGTTIDASTIPVDAYVVVIDGTGEGQIREVTSITCSAGNSVVSFEIKYAFQTTLSSATDDNRSWVQFIKVNREYAADIWPCKEFLKSLDGLTSNIPELFSFSNNKFSRISDFGLTVKSVNNNSLNIDGTQFSDNIDNLDGHVFLPVSNLQLETKDDLTDWSYSGEDFSGFIKHVDGLYKDRALEAGLTIASVTGLVDAANAVDKDSNTYAEFNSEIYFPLGSFMANDYNIKKVLKFNLPAIPENIDEIDSIALVIKMQAHYNMINTDGLFKVRIILRRFAYTKSTDVFLKDKIVLQRTSEQGHFDDVPEFYASNAGYVNFYKASEPYSGVNYNSMTGVTNFTLTLTKDEYRSFIEGGILIDRDFTHTEVADYGIDDTDFLKIHEIAIAFKMPEASIANEVYSPLAGRNFASTWDGRKTASDLIEKPVDLLEHVCRLQSWHDRGNVPVSGWGLQYSDDALIATSGHGSFDSITGRDLYAAGQLLEEEEGYTDKAKQVICRNFGIANWQDSNGYERAIALPTSALAPIFTVTLDSIIDRQRIKIHEPRQTDIFAEPFVRYQKNPATGEYEKIIVVKNASAGTYSSTYIDGVQNSGEAQAIWQTCHSLYLKTHQITKPPTDLTDLTWANGAGGYSIALAHLQRWIQWQSNTEIEFPLHVNDCLSWAECSPVNLVFSHQTNNVIRSALVESVELNPNTPYEAMIKAIMYS